MIRTVSTFPWGDLILVAGPLAGSLGAIALKSRGDLKRDRQRAEHRQQVRQAERQRQVHTALLLKARVAVKNYRTLRIAYTTSLFGDPSLKVTLERTDAITEDLQLAVARVESEGTLLAPAAGVINDAAFKIIDMYSRRSLDLRLMTPAAGQPFDIEAAENAIEDLTKAINVFTDELGAVASREPAVPRQAPDRSRSIRR
jgi:hypothetical protein